MDTQGIQETPSHGQSSRDGQGNNEPVELFVFTVASQPISATATGLLPRERNR
jgi:hypothetical protein